MEKHLHPTEKHEIELNRFSNKYKNKTISEMSIMTLEIKSSSISEFEHTLKSVLRGDISKMTLSQLCHADMVFSKLIDNNTTEKDKLIGIYSKIQEEIQMT